MNDLNFEQMFTVMLEGYLKEIDIIVKEMRGKKYEEVRRLFHIARRHWFLLTPFHDYIKANYPHGANLFADLDKFSELISRMAQYSDFSIPLIPDADCLYRLTDRLKDIDSILADLSLKSKEEAMESVNKAAYYWRTDIGPYQPLMRNKYPHASKVFDALDKWRSDDLDKLYGLLPIDSEFPLDDLCNGMPRILHNDNIMSTNHSVAASS